MSGHGTATIPILPREELVRLAVRALGHGATVGAAEHLHGATAEGWRIAATSSTGATTVYGLGATRRAAVGDLAWKLREIAARLRGASC